MASALKKCASDAVELLAALIQQARLNRRMTIEDLALALKVSPADIQKLEEGDPTVAVGTFESLLPCVFDCSTLTKT